MRPKRPTRAALIALAGVGSAAASCLDASGSPPLRDPPTEERRGMATAAALAGSEDEKPVEEMSPISSTSPYCDVAAATLARAMRDRGFDHVPHAPSSHDMPCVRATAVRLAFCSDRLAWVCRCRQAVRLAFCSERLEGG